MSFLIVFFLLNIEILLLDKFLSSKVRNDIGSLLLSSLNITRWKDIKVKRTIESLKSKADKGDALKIWICFVHDRFDLKGFILLFDLHELSKFNIYAQNWQIFKHIFSRDVIIQKYNALY